MIGSDGNGDDGDDRWPHEPEEFDPDSLGPRVDVPEVEVDNPADRLPDYSDADVPAEVSTAFWSTVLMVNVGVLAVSVGAMLVGFRGDLRRGGALIAIGAVALALAYRRYRAFVDRNRDRADGGDRDDEPPDGAVTPTRSDEPAVGIEPDGGARETGDRAGNDERDRTVDHD